MNGSLRMARDGREITGTGGIPPANSRDRDPRLEILQPFVDACLVMLPEEPLTVNGRIGVLLFLLGAADRLWVRLYLGDARFPAFAESLLQMHGRGHRGRDSGERAAADPRTRGRPRDAAGRSRDLGVLAGRP